MTSSVLDVQLGRYNQNNGSDCQQSYNVNFCDVRSIFHIRLSMANIMLCPVQRRYEEGTTAFGQEENAFPPKQVRVYIYLVTMAKSNE